MTSPTTLFIRGLLLTYQKRCLETCDHESWERASLIGLCFSRSSVLALCDIIFILLILLSQCSCTSDVVHFQQSTTIWCIRRRSWWWYFSWQGFFVARLLLLNCNPFKLYHYYYWCSMCDMDTITDISTWSAITDLLLQFSNRSRWNHYKYIIISIRTRRNDKCLLNWQTI